MAFTYYPTTTRGRVRLLVSDTDLAVTKNQIFSDAEIDGFLALENQEIYMAAAAACEALAASAAKSNIAWSAAGQSIDLKGTASHFRALAAIYRKRASDGAPFEEISADDIQIGPWGADRSEFVGDTYWG